MFFFILVNFIIGEVLRYMIEHRGSLFCTLLYIITLENLLINFLINFLYWLLKKFAIISFLSRIININLFKLIIFENKWKQYGVNLQEDIRVSTSMGDIWALRCSCHKGTLGPPSNLVFSKSSAIIIGFRNVRLILGHSNENPVYWNTTNASILNN